MFKNKSILITGGTGSFGQSFLDHLIKNFKGFKKIIIFSRDELKQFDMQQKFNSKKFPFLRYFLGDIRDKDRIKLALEDVDIVIHAAALKQVTASEYNPFETIKTNIIGSQNIIEGSLDSNVSKVVALSTDKAVAPVNLYGATKLCAEKLFVSANNMVGNRNLSFSVVRYGNVMGSRGSVIPVFLKQKKEGILNITDKKMTRFNITMDQSISLVLDAIKHSVGGEIFIPKIPSIKITDLAKAISKNSKIKFIGVRPGEKIHEELISSNEMNNVRNLKKYYVILPDSIQLHKINKKLIKKYKNDKIKTINDLNNYSSGNNKEFLSTDQIKKLIELNIK